MERILLSEAVAAKRIGFTREWLRKLRTKGLGPRYISFPNSNRILYDAADVDAWVETLKTKEERNE
jgi:6-phosphogluconolactonase (cycloisomerase 2 family)